LKRILDLNQEWIGSFHKAGQRADLQGAHLAKADLRNANLSGINLQGADLSDAELDGAIIGSDLPIPSPPTLTAVRHLGDVNGPASTYFDLLVYFFRAMISSTPQANNECGWKAAPHSDAANFSFVSLRNARLTNSKFLFTDLTGSDLAGAILDGAQFQSVELKNANIVGGSLRQTNILTSHLFGADLSKSDLTSASLFGSDLNYAVLRDAKLDGAVFNGSEVCQLDFEPASSVSDPRSLVYAKGLQYLTFADRPDALTRLRDQFRDEGFRAQERKLTFALKFHEETEYWGQCVTGSATRCVEFTFNEFLFDQTCRYGMEPERALLLLARLWLLCTLAYWFIMRFSKHSALYLVPARRSAISSYAHSRIQRLRPHPRRARSGRTNMRGNLWVRGLAFLRSRPISRLRRSVRRKCTLIRAAILFSTMSAFNIGFRDIAAGRWIRLLTKREYDLKATGWARVIAGLQAVVSVGLLALWLLTYFGRPFG
jgi:uncharacterized protein YjbI with pentapeptide repeats